MFIPDRFPPYFPTIVDYIICIPDVEEIIFVGMNDLTEIQALLNLIDDPDQEVFDAVSHRIINYGSPIIPHLEDLWENTTEHEVQEKIEFLIHRLQFSTLLSDFREWASSAHQEILPATLLVAKFLYPEMLTGKIIQDIERLRRNIWLELNHYLTPVEQVKVLKSILYDYFGIKGNYNNPEQPAEYLVSGIMERKRGNQTGIGVLYLLLAELLDLPVRLIGVPNQFILAYCKSVGENEQEKLHLNMDFFIDPVTGQAFSHDDLNNYFDRIHLAPKPSFFKPRSNKEVIIRLLSDFSKCFEKDEKLYMKQELNEIIDSLSK